MKQHLVIICILHYFEWLKDLYKNIKIGQRWDKFDVSFGPWKQENSWEGHIYILRKQIERMATSHPKHSQ
jgi:hypothetical protein